MSGESDKKRIHIPAECLERSHTAFRTIPSALEGNRSKYLWVFDQPFPSTPISFTSYQSISSSDINGLCANNDGDRLKATAPPNN